uniref:Uncharacterized protein n=1 Tax=Sus scrofa TaxID=9823 RepID=A0A4X1SXV7_PIG
MSHQQDQCKQRCQPPPVCPAMSTSRAMSTSLPTCGWPLTSLSPSPSPSPLPPSSPVLYPPLCISQSLLSLSLSRPFQLFRMTQCLLVLCLLTILSHGPFTSFLLQMMSCPSWSSSTWCFRFP